MFAGLFYVGFSAFMFSLYSFMPVVMKRTSATSVNLSVLTADLYSLFCGLFLFHYKVKSNCQEALIGDVQVKRCPDICRECGCQVLTRKKDVWNKKDNTSGSVASILIFFLTVCHESDNIIGVP